jgi:hypothetical protein
VRWLLVFGCLAGPFQMASAAEVEGRDNFNVFVGADTFRWEESSGGVALMEDTGWRGHVGIGWSNLFIPSGGPVYKAYVKLYGGMPTSECSVAGCGTAEEVDSKYLGIQVEGMGGYRFGTIAGVEIFSGVGLDIWARQIEAGTIVNAVDYLFGTLYMKFGVSFLQRFDSFGYFLRAGIKAPLYVYETVDVTGFDTITLTPVPRISPFASLDFTFGGMPRDRFVLSFYYDTYRFAQSDPEEIKVNSVPTGIYTFQPDTDMSVAGVQLIFGF